MTLKIGDETRIICSSCEDTSKGFKFISANKNKNEAKFMRQGQSARSQRWFDIQFDWIKVNFSTREPDFLKKLFQIHDNTQYTIILKIFQVPIDNIKCVEIFMFHNDSPILKYFQKLLNRCFFNGLEPYFSSIEKPKASNYI